MGKRNFRGFKDVQQYLYKSSQDLAAGKISPAAAQAASRIASEWLKAFNLAETEDLKKRLEGVEHLLKQREVRK